MQRSLGLAAYRALTRRGEGRETQPSGPRPEGELVWLHAAEPGSLLALQDLAQRLCISRPDLSVLITVPEGGETIGPGPQTKSVLVETVADEHPSSVAAFLDHWSPDCGVWVWGRLRPNLILEADRRHIPMFLIDADTNGFDARRDRWMTEMTRQLLSCFTTILARSDAGYQRLIKIGVARNDVEVTSPLQAGGNALPCDEDDLADLSAALVGRPIWFAAQVQQDELDRVMAAHRQALRLSHRLLLILNPAPVVPVATCEAMAAERDLRILHWGQGTYPDDSVQMMIADDPDDIGLFFRVAPVSFLGSSLSAGSGGGCDPFEAAALGSAILYGPKVRRFLPSYTRLASEGAARIVNDATALGTAVSRLIAPDQAAAMAHAGWDVISRGAALTDKVVDLVQDALDRKAGVR